MMPLENLFRDKDIAPEEEAEDRRKTLCEFFGVLSNPFPSAGRTSGHPHLPTQADAQVDAAVREFYLNRKSHVIAITASQGIGKTNLLNAYEDALREKLGPQGFYVIRYVADPEPSFDPLLRSIFEYLGEKHLKRTIENFTNKSEVERTLLLDSIRTMDVRKMIERLVEEKGKTEDELDLRLFLAQQWLMGLPVRNPHREQLGVSYRLDTTESKTRAFRDIVYFSAKVETLGGVFLLLDELEKQFAQPRSAAVRYLLAIRALIDALPDYLFLMLAMTPDALERYREMVPALRGRLANQVTLPPLTTVEQAISLYEFYLKEARKEAENAAGKNKWRLGTNDLLSVETARATFSDLLKRTTIRGVRQRDYLNALYEKANEKIEVLMI